MNNPPEIHALKFPQSVYCVSLTLDQANAIEGVTGGRYDARLWQKDYAKIQIVTIAGLLDGTETIAAPPQLNPFAMAVQEATEHKQTEML